MRASPVLLIGGSGTLGSNLLSVLLSDPGVSRIRVLSRGEHRQSECKESLARKHDVSRIDWLIGDVRDAERISHAAEGCESVFNFAAMKSVDRAEYDAEECTKTNVIGALNVIKACQTKGVKRAFFTSTDKAVSPTNLYGATKLVAEKLFIQGNVGSSECRFSVARYGNVMASQGSVIQCWEAQKKAGQPNTLTVPTHTRFFITPQRAAQFVYDRWSHMRGGETFIPKMKSTTMADLLLAFGGRVAEAKIIGVRPGEKEHEALISPDEAEFVTDCVDHFVRWPYKQDFPVRGRLPTDAPVKPYTSETAERFKIDELKAMIEEVKSAY